MPFARWSLNGETESKRRVSVWKRILIYAKWCRVSKPSIGHSDERQIRRAAPADRGVRSRRDHIDRECAPEELFHRLERNPGLPEFVDGEDLASLIQRRDSDFQ